MTYLPMYTFNDLLVYLIWLSVCSVCFPHTIHICLNCFICSSQCVYLEPTGTRCLPPLSLCSLSGNCHLLLQLTEVRTLALTHFCTAFRLVMRRFGNWRVCSVCNFPQPQFILFFSKLKVGSIFKKMSDCLVFSTSVWFFDCKPNRPHH